MGVSYFITPVIIENKTGEISELNQNFTIDLNQFKDALNSRWHEAQVSVSAFPGTALYWECKVKESYSLNGNIQRDRQAIVLEKPSQFDVAEFALWYRSFVPTEYRLSLFNDSEFPKNLELRSDTTYLQILHFFTHLDYLPTIAPPRDKNFKLSLKDFEFSLSERWPDAKIYPAQANDPYSFYWEIISEVEIESRYPEIPSHTLNVLQAGAIGLDQATLYLYYYPEAEIAKFAIWFRSIVPQEIELEIYIQVKNISLLLEKDTSEQQIIESLKPMFL